MSKLKSVGLVAGPLCFILIYFFTSPEGLSDGGRAVMAATCWIAIWWTLEVAPMAVTALLPIVLFPLTQAVSLSETTASYGHKYVFLFIGGFILALAIEKWNLHQRIALQIINSIGTGMSNILLGFMIATAFLSMWISNTATAVMMLPIGTSVIAQVEKGSADLSVGKPVFGKALMLAIGYAASVGGMATLIGTPPNLVFSGILSDTYGVEITFLSWLKIGLPVSVILLFLVWLYLTRVAFKLGNKTLPGGKKEIRSMLDELGRMSFEEKSVLAVFCSAAFCWVFRDVLLSPVLPAIDDSIIAIGFAVVLFLLPAGRKNQQAGKRPRLLVWGEAVKLPWGILLLYGGGLSLAHGFEETGLANWLGAQISAVDGLSLLLLMLLLVAAVNFLTEVTSNLATTSMLLPVLIPIALTFSVHPFMLMVSVTLAASCAFMLPVATPPNAIVFGSGYLRIPDMMRAGIGLNLLSILLITFIIYLFLPLIWDINPEQIPPQFKPAE